MPETKQLRLLPGDWVNDTEGKPFAVTASQVETIHTGIEFGLPPVCSPIPLTIDRLWDWYGIDETHPAFELLGYDLTMSPEGVLRIVPDGLKVNGWIKTLLYIHELQHLCEALTGEPLKRIDL